MRRRIAFLLLAASLQALAWLTPPAWAQAPMRGALPRAPWPVWTPDPVAVSPSATGMTYYVDAKTGNDANAGTSVASAFATLKKAITKVAAGDTVLIRAGLYRESMDLSNAASGVAGKPITFGSYGDGEVIIDGSAKVSGWTQVSGSVWRAPVSFTPIATVVNEVPLKQTYDGASAVTAGSGKWFYDATAKTITADFGSASPSTADIVVPNNNGAQYHIFFYGSYYTFKGLTIRGSGSAGIWGYGSHITVERCNIKFNGKGAVAFLGPGDTDNAVLYSHAYHNVLINWPRGNNGYADAGGGWPGAVSWFANYRPLARGNIVHMNGGEGILSYGTVSGKTSGSALFEQNVVYDNWSVNMYFDNQPNDVARNNIIFNHPADPSNWLKTGSSWPWNEMYKYNSCLMLADEQGSSDATGNYANLANTQVYNNLIAGCRVSIRDYSEGSTSIKYHGLRNTLIANNTIILPPRTVGDVIGLYLQDNVSPAGVNRNAGTSIVNNIIVGVDDSPLVWIASARPPTGVLFSHNLYHSPKPGSAFRLGAFMPRGHGVHALKEYATSLARRLAGNGAGILSFEDWRQLGHDVNSQFAAPGFVRGSALQPVQPLAYDYANARIQPGSADIGKGIPQPTFRNNLAGDIRHEWTPGAL
jgi:hypothetical protein